MSGAFYADIRKLRDYCLNSEYDDIYGFKINKSYRNVAVTRNNYKIKKNT